MHIHNHLDVINACRFCFMCRHLDTTANVTFREADIPRGRALILDRIRMNPEQLRNPDFIRTMYDCALSAACRKHCVSDYDETGLVLAARRDIVEAGLAPTDVQELSDTIAAEFAVETTGDTGDTLYVAPTVTMADQPEIGNAFGRIMGTAGIPYRTLRVSDTGKALAVLGFTARAREQADQVRDAIIASGCITVVTSCPAAFDALRNDFPTLGRDVRHSSTYLLGLIADGKLLPGAAGTRAHYVDSDFLRNYNDIIEEPRELLSACGYTLEPFGTNPEESYGLGEGAVVLDRLRPDLTRLMRERFVALMDAADTTVVTASPYTRHVLRNLGGRPVDVLSIEEAVANV